MSENTKFKGLRERKNMAHLGGGKERDVLVEAGEDEVPDELDN